MVLQIKGKKYKELNKLLKRSLLEFNINPADISDPGMKVDAKFDKKGGVKKVYCTLSGKKIKLKKGSYSIQAPEEDDITIEANGNFTGKRKLNRSH